jgi:ketosteroid isomerase-like protein
MRSDLDATTQQILAIEHEVFEAIRTKNVEALSRWLADDFAYRSPGRAAQNRNAFLTGVAAIPGDILNVEAEEAAVKVVGPAVVVCGVQRAEVRLAGGETIISRVAFTDVFEHRPSGWKLVLAYGIELE